MRAGRCGGLTRQPLTGTWFRALPLRHWRTRLSSHHSITAASRYSAATATNPRYRIVYLAQTQQVAVHEVRALLGNPHSPVANPSGSWALLNLQVVLDHVVNLSLEVEQRIISTNHAELTGNWINFPGTAPTQELGQSLFSLPDLEGFVYSSSFVDGLCLGIFPDKLGRRSSITFINEMNRNKREHLS